MSLSRAAIVDQLKEIVGADRVITDETVLKKNSIDRFRKFPDIHGIYTLPIPAAVVKLGSTEQVSGNDSNLLIVFYVQIMPDD
ncbi:hypothetical protein HEP04_013870, partial [Escherichia coli]|nr:hypothetical protein [Escherichia coli]